MGDFGTQRKVWALYFLQIDIYKIDHAPIESKIE